MKDITKRELVDYCESRESEVCNECEHYIECLVFIRKTGHIPQGMRNTKHYADEYFMEGVK